MSNEKGTKRQYNKKIAKSVRDLNLNQMVDDMKQPAMVALGVVASVNVSNRLKKALEEKSNVSGLLGIDPKKLTKFIVPAVSVIGGLGATQFTRNPHWKTLWMGVATNGCFMVAKDLLGKNLLNGFDDASVGNALPEPDPIAVQEYQHTQPLDLPLYEIEEPSINNNSAFDRMMAEEPVNGNLSAGQFHLAPEPDKTPILNSDRPEDNYEKEEDNEFEEGRIDVDLPQQQEEISGQRGQVAAPIGQQPIVPVYHIPEQEEEELDFSEIA